MEHTLRNTYFSGLSLCLGIFLWDFRTKGFLSFLLFYFQSVCNFISQTWNSWTSSRTVISEPLKQSSKCFPNGVRLSKEGVITVMGNLKLGVESDGKGLNEVFGEEEVAEMFEKEPSLGEVTSAFEVFDENRDGFIEARELQRVLRCLGMEKDVGECERMVNAVDENGDGVVDHNEFVKLLEQSFG